MREDAIASRFDVLGDVNPDAVAVSHRELPQVVVRFNGVLDVLNDPSSHGYFSALLVISTDGAPGFVVMARRIMSD